LQIFNGINNFISAIGESYVFKIKHQFTEHDLGSLAKGAIFVSSVI